MHHVAGVDRLQAPPARPRDGPGFAVRSEGEHLGADQLDLLAGAFDFRTNPEVALGGYGPEQVDQHPAQSGVVSGFAALQCTYQQR